MLNDTPSFATGRAACPSWRQKREGDCGQGWKEALVLWRWHVFLRVLNSLVFPRVLSWVVFIAVVDVERDSSLARITSEHDEHECNGQ
jgi:hypothetical protein